MRFILELDDEHIIDGATAEQIARDLTEIIEADSDTGYHAYVTAVSE